MEQNQHQEEQQNIVQSENVEDAVVENIATDQSVVEPTEMQSSSLNYEKELAEAKDANLRLIAEMQNLQRRNQEELKKARDFAISSFAKEIIVVKDYLEMALKDQSGNFEMLKMGVDLTLQQLIKVFEGHHVKDINPQPKEKLDANLHQAMSVIEEHAQEPNTIIEVMQKGYLLNGRVLRPAMVTVAK